MTTRAERPRGRVLDVAALVQAITGKPLYARVLVELALAAGTATLLIPVTCYVQALAELPADVRWRLMLLTTSPGVELDLLDDREKAHEIADLAAADTTLAHVAWCGLHYGWPVVSDRMADLRTVAPAVEVEPLP